MRFELFLALRYLKGGRHTLGGAFTSVVAVASVTVGVAALIATLAVMTGFREDIRRKILGAQPHLIVMSQTGSLPEADYAYAFDGVDDVRSWSPFFLEQALLKSGPRTQGVVVKGVDPAREPAVTGLSSHIVSGEWGTLSSTAPMVFLGVELARTLDVGRGDDVILVVPSASSAVFGELPALHRLVVAGTLETGLYDYDANLAVVSLPTAQSAFEKPHAWSGLGVRVADPDDPFGVAFRIQKNIGSSAYVRSWLAMNRNLFAALKLEKVVMFLILTLITLVASFTILSNLILVAAQKIREIGILKAMGATPGIIGRAFLIQGMILGLIGAGAGTVLGVGISLFLKAYPVVSLPADVYYVERLPVTLVPSDILMVAGAAVLIVLSATVYPARLAAKLDALTAVRQS
jgi:lipoprotein-releasing system permease protein